MRVVETSPKAAGAEASHQLIIRAECPFTEITIFDARFRVLEHRLGSASVDVHPGLYEVRFRSDAQLYSEYVNIEHINQHVRGPILKVHSPAPLAGGHDDAKVGQFVQGLSLEPTTVRGVGGSWLLLVL